MRSVVAHSFSWCRFIKMFRLAAGIVALTAPLRELPAQSFIQQPQGGTRYPGDGFLLSCVVAGDPPLTYQWFQDGNLLAGATNSQLFLTDLALTAAGNYTVIASNGSGSSTSAPAALVILSDTTITSTIQDVRHVVIFMQENRSFDHYFGTLKGVCGFSDRNALQLTNGNTVFFQPQGSSYVLPFHYTPQCLDDVEHDWGAGHEVWNSGHWDRWQINGPSAMTYFTRDDLPYYYSLAEAYTLCDAYHCSVMGPTFPNRLYLMTGMMDPNGTGGGPRLDNSLPPFGFTWTTYPERLQAAGVSWKVYQQFSDFFPLNALDWFAQYRFALPGNPLHDKGVALVNNLVSAFQADVANDTLPRVSWIIPPWSLSEHPPYSPANGERLTKQLLDALASNPTVYNSTVFILTYDEAGGFFDHDPSPVPPPGTPDEFIIGEPIGLGVRVPTILVSPWTRGGYRCSQVFDHSSVIRFLETWTGVQEPNISAWRRQVCGDLTSAFNFTSPNADYPYLSTVPAINCSDGNSPSAPAQQTVPTQESGARPDRPLPYQPNAVSLIDCGAGQFGITMTNAGAASIHLAIYPNAYRTDGPWQYDVDANNSVSDGFDIISFGGGLYDLTCYGPNGFQRRFAGNVNANCNQVELTSAIDPVAGTIALFMQNLTTSTVVFTVTNDYPTGGPWTYNVPAGSTVTDTFPAVANNNGLYDLTATADSDALFVRRLAGHIEAVDFSFVVTPNTQSVTVGSNATYAITVGAITGFGGGVVLSLGNLPTGVNAVFDPPSVAGSGTSTLCLSVSGDAMLGSYPLTITATSSNITHTANIMLTIVPLDTDGDGVPDSWTQQYFGSSTGLVSNLSMAYQDADGTGQNNLFKYAAGLDPTNPASVFMLQIQNVPGQPNQKTLIFGPRANGRTYIVESNTDAAKGSYLALGSFGGPQTNGNQVTVTDLNAVGTQIFYRVHITYP